MSDCEIVRTHDEKVVLSLTLAEARVVKDALRDLVHGQLYSFKATGQAEDIADDIEETIDGLEHGQGDDEDE